MKVTPHVARCKWSGLDQRTTRHPGHQVSQRIRRRVEEIFGWIKTVGGGCKLRYRGVDRNQLWAELTAVAYDLLRMARLAVMQAGPTGRTMPIFPGKGSKRGLNALARAEKASKNCEDKHFWEGIMRVTYRKPALRLNFAAPC